MAAFAPFEAAPKLLVGVSGGADSMALALLAHDWCQDREGRVIAATVDHGLRAASAEEAKWVGQELGKYGIDHAILPWIGEKPTGAVQEQARNARYDILDAFMAANGVLHLLIAHHAGDQDETIAMRAARGAGGLGQAGMSARRYLRYGRVLRPLLSVSKSDLVATLQSRGQAWIEDPSNINEKFERVRTRKKISESTASAIENAAAIDVRLRLECEIGDLLAKSVTLHTNGVALIRRDSFLVADVPSDGAIYALGQVVRTVGGAGYMPALDRLSDALARLTNNATARISLGGCILHGRKGAICVYRELGRMDQAPMRVELGSMPESSCFYWDNRFEWHPDGGHVSGDEVLWIGPLGLCDVFHTKAFRTALREIVPFIGNLPRAALASMPSLYDKEGLRSVGGLEVSVLSDVLSAADCERPLGRGQIAIGGRWQFAPRVPLWECGFKLPKKPDSLLA
ncbi:MAG: tRNA lysidine(34) synthetase TilS [Thalassospira sp.]|uniref:tRNA lysidine(34) synthetase TilS n=1 Tax=Thalassospira sp. TaxID=1912094 RepID=UPI003A880BA6